MRRATERFRRQPTARRLTVSTTPGFAAKWLVPRLHSFQDRHPGIDVRIGTGMDLVDFRRDEVDVAIRFGKGTWPGLHAEFVHQPVAAEQVVLPRQVVDVALVAVLAIHPFGMRRLGRCGGRSTLFARHQGFFR